MWHHKHRAYKKKEFASNGIPQSNISKQQIEKNNKGNLTVGILPKWLLGKVETTRNVMIVRPCNHKGNLIPSCTSPTCIC